MACCVFGAMILAQWLATWDRLRDRVSRLLGRTVQTPPPRLPPSLRVPLRSRPWFRRLVALELLVAALLLWNEGGAAAEHAGHSPQALLARVRTAAGLLAQPSAEAPAGPVCTAPAQQVVRH